MIENFDTIIDSKYILILFMGLIGFAFWSYNQLEKLISKKYLWIITSLRILSAIFISLILLRPYDLLKKENAESFKTVILADCSESMKAKDCENRKTRFDIVNEIIEKNRNNKLLDKKYKKETYIFSDKKNPCPKENLSILPGNSAIGNIIEDVANTKDMLLTGGILLISDGNSNNGADIIDAAKLCKQKSIPINCIGIGEVIKDLDISINATKTAINAVKKEPFKISATVSNTFDTQKEVMVSLYQGESLIEEQQTILPANNDKKVTYETISVLAGMQSYRVIVEQLKCDEKPETNTAYINVNVKEPDNFKILYLGNSLNWNYKFLKLYTNNNKQLELSSVIQLSKKKFYITENLRKELKVIEEFPEKIEFYNKFDIIILDTRTIPLFNIKLISNIISFTANRGGGILCFGPVNQNLGEINKIIPIINSSKRNALSKTYLNVNSSVIFPEKSSETLHSTPALFVSENESIFEATKLKPGARALINTINNEKAILSVQQYGTGRVAYFANESSWQWHLGSDFDQKRYDLLWNKLFIWLASTAKSQLEIGFNSSKVAINQAINLDIKVHNKNYKPAMNAKTNIIITKPNKEIIKLPMYLSSENAGIYSTSFTPRISGEYKTTINTQFPDGTSINKVAYFLANPKSKELLENNYQENILKDVSRITGGKFINYKDIKYPLELNFSEKIPVIIKKFYLCETWIFLILLFSALIAEWTFKRKIGLK